MPAAVEAMGGIKAALPPLRTDDPAAAAPALRLCLLGAMLAATRSQLLHHSSSPTGPWIPVIPPGCNGSTGIWRDGGGANQSPFFVTEAVSKATGLPNNSIVAITMFSNHPRGQPSPNATLNAYMAAGLAKTWRDPMVINPTPLFLGGVLTGWEDPYIFFDLSKKKWRVLYHEITGKPNACKSCGQPMQNITKHCGGYAESVTPDLWGDWVVSPPQRGAYTLDIDFAGFSNTTAGAGGDDAAAASPAWRRPPAVPRSSDSASAPPFELGKSYAIYANASLTAWGGNAVLGDDGSYHLYTSACVPLHSLVRRNFGLSASGLRRAACRPAATTTDTSRTSSPGRASSTRGSGTPSCCTLWRPRRSAPSRRATWPCPPRTPTRRCADRPAACPVDSSHRR